MKEVVWTSDRSHRVYKDCFGICHPEGIVCCELCLRLNGFDAKEVKV